MTAPKVDHLGDIQGAVDELAGAMDGLWVINTAVRSMGLAGGMHPTQAAGAAWLGTMVMEEAEHQLRVIKDAVEALRAGKGKPPLKLADPGPQ